MPNVDYDISFHCADRLQERVGLRKSQKSQEAFLKKVKERGISIKDIPKSEKLYKLLYNYCKDQEGTYSIYFSNYVVIFTESNIAITVLNANDNLIKCVKNYCKRRHIDGCCTSKKIS